MADTPAPVPMSKMLGVIPYVAVNGAAKAMEFYQKAFAAEVLAPPMAAPDNPNLVIHTHLFINGGSIMLSDVFNNDQHSTVMGNNVHLTLVVADGKAWYDRAVAAGCTVGTPFEQMFWGDKYGQVTDPFGVMWAINQPANQV